MKVPGQDEGRQQGSGRITCVGERQSWRQFGDRWGTAGEGEGVGEQTGGEEAVILGMG